MAIPQRKYTFYGAVQAIGVGGEGFFIN